MLHCPLLEIINGSTNEQDHGGSGKGEGVGSQGGKLRGMLEQLLLSRCGVVWCVVLHDTRSIRLMLCTVYNLCATSVVSGFMSALFFSFGGRGVGWKSSAVQASSKPFLELFLGLLTNFCIGTSLCSFMSTCVPLAIV